MKRILVLGNSASGLYDFRNELLLKLLAEYEVFVSLPDEETKPELQAEGCQVIHTDLERRGMNPLRDMKLIKAYRHLLKGIRPDIVLTYTIKPNIYGGICCRLQKVPYITNITGLGSVFEKGGMVCRLVVMLYRMALKKASCVFFQNEKNRDIFKTNQIIKRQITRLVPGSGVSLQRHHMEEYPAKDEPVEFLYVGRIMKEKGMDEFLSAAPVIKKDFPETSFTIVGYYEDDYKEQINKLEADGTLTLVSYQKDMHPYYTKASAVVMPSYHEGMSNVVLEAAATARPVLATNIPGCQEGIEDNKTGILFAPRNKEAMEQAFRRFLSLTYEEREQMGQAGRKKMEQEFDRQIVVNAYIEEIRKLTGDS